MVGGCNHDGQPLSFLDHHIVCGNSLLGTTPELLAERSPPNSFQDHPYRGRPQTTGANTEKPTLPTGNNETKRILALGWQPYNDVASLADDLTVINTGADTTPADIAVKAELYEELQQSDTYTRAKLAADAWCAAFVSPKTNEHPSSHRQHHPNDRPRKHRKP